jgi:hypothetical protein
MSTIKATTLSTQSNATVPIDTVVNGTAKAWVNFNGTGTVAIRASFNVSSITDNGVANFTMNFTTAMPDANYAAVGSGRELLKWLPWAGNQAAGSVQMVLDADASHVAVAIFR